MPVYRQKVPVVISWPLCMLLLFSHHTDIYSKHAKKKQICTYMKWTFIIPIFGLLFYLSCEPICIYHALFISIVIFSQLKRKSCVTFVCFWCFPSSLTGQIHAYHFIININITVLFLLWENFIRFFFMKVHVVACIKGMTQHNNKNNEHEKIRKLFERFVIKKKIQGNIKAKQRYLYVFNLSAHVITVRPPLHGF